MPKTLDITKTDIVEGLEVARKAKVTPPVKSTPKTPTTPKVSAKPKVTQRTAAQVARDNGLDAKRFRAYLRSMDIDRTFPNKTQADKAVRNFRKAIADSK